MITVISVMCYDVNLCDIFGITDICIWGAEIRWEGDLESVARRVLYN